MIETPVVLNMLRNTEDEFFTAAVRAAKYVDQPLAALPSVDKVTVSKIFRHGQTISPDEGTVLEEGGQLFFAGPRNIAEKLRAALR